MPSRPEPTPRPRGSPDWGRQESRPAAGGAGGEFGALLQGAVDSFAQSGRKAEAQALAAAAGKADVVDVVTAVAESEAALETLVAVRDRVIAAYEEIMRMPI